MAVGNESAVFFPNNRVPISPTRSNSKVKPKVSSPQARNKLQLDLSPDQYTRGKHNLPASKVWNKGRHSPSKSVSPSGPKTPPSSPIGIKTPQAGNAPLYAGFTESPAPGSLPKPPSHWVFPTTMSTGFRPSELSRQLSLSVKTFLDVHA